MVDISLLVSEALPIWPGDPGVLKDRTTRHALLRNNVIIIEGLSLADGLSGDDAPIALPLKIKGKDGPPPRVILRERSTKT